MVGHVVLQPRLHDGMSTKLRLQQRHFLTQGIHILQFVEYADNYNIPKNTMPFECIPATFQGMLKLQNSQPLLKRSKNTIKTVPIIGKETEQFRITLNSPPHSERQQLQQSETAPFIQGHCHHHSRCQTLLQQPSSACQACPFDVESRVVRLALGLLVQEQEQEAEQSSSVCQVSLRE